MDRYERAALRHANKVIRAEGGTPRETLLPGNRRNACSCPISNTVRAGLGLGKGVGTGQETTNIWLLNGSGELETVYPLSTTASKFVLNFDHGFDLYPHLVKQA